MRNKIYLFICLPQLSVFSHFFTPLLLILQSLSSTYCLHVDKQELAHCCARTMHILLCILLHISLILPDFQGFVCAYVI